MAVAGLAIATGCGKGGARTTNDEGGASTGAAGAHVNQEQQKVSQQLAEARVRSAVFGALQQRGAGVTVKWDDDTNDVSLGGKVPNGDLAAKAEKAAKGVPGVGRVVNEIKVDSGLKPDPSDEALAIDHLTEARIHSALLETMGARALDIKVSSQNGMVELSGDVPGVAERQQALKLAQSIPDVYGVRDNMKQKTD